MPEYSGTKKRGESQRTTYHPNRTSRRRRALALVQARLEFWLDWREHRMNQQYDMGVAGFMELNTPYVDIKINTARREIADLARKGIAGRETPVVFDMSEEPS